MQIARNLNVPVFCRENLSFFTRNSKLIVSENLDEILNAKNNKDDADRALKALDMDSDYRAKEEKRRREESENAKGELATIMSDIENTKGIIEDAKKKIIDGEIKVDRAVDMKTEDVAALRDSMK